MERAAWFFLLACFVMAAPSTLRYCAGEARKPSRIETPAGRVLAMLFTAAMFAAQFVVMSLAWRALP